VRVFKLTVSTPTRKGSIPHHERVFTSESTQSALYNKFVADYRGFQVTVSEVENIEAVEASAQVPRARQETFWEAPVFTVKPTEDELTQILQIHELVKQTEALEKKVGDEIVKRITAKAWVSDSQYNIRPELRKFQDTAKQTIRVENVRLNWAVVTGQGEGPVYDTF
jgi:hypothetical protein